MFAVSTAWTFNKGSSQTVNFSSKLLKIYVDKICFYIRIEITDTIYKNHENLQIYFVVRNL